MLSYNELKPGVFIVLNGQPFAVLEAQFLRMQMRKPVMKAKLKNLFSGAVVERSFQQTDELEEADLERIKAKFLYSNRGARPQTPEPARHAFGKAMAGGRSDGGRAFWFCEADNPKNRFMLKSEIIGSAEKFLKTNLEVEAFKFNGQITSIELPIKVDYKVVEAPPTIRGDTAQGGNKTITIETGAKINVPLFINEGDTIRINTQTGEYVERIEKG